MRYFECSYALLYCTHGPWAVACNACLGGITSEWINVAGDSEQHVAKSFQCIGI